MNLKCRINEKEYDVVVQGTTFSDEYNETLDSGSIILDHIEEIKDLKPYDDVYIYDGEFDRKDSERRFYNNLIVEKNSNIVINSCIYNNFVISATGEAPIGIKRIYEIINEEPNKYILGFSSKAILYQGNTYIKEFEIVNSKCNTEIIENKLRIYANTPLEIKNLDGSISSNPNSPDFVSKLAFTQALYKLSSFKENEISLNFTFDENKTKMTWDIEPQTNSENNGIWIKFYDTKIIDVYEAFRFEDGDLIFDFLHQNQEVFVETKREENILLTIDNNFGLENGKIISGIRISDNFTFSVTITKNKENDENEEIKKVYTCFITKDNNNDIRLKSEKCSSFILKGETLDIGNHYFVDDGIFLKVKKEEVEKDKYKYIFFKETNTYENIGDYFTYSFEFENIPFAINEQENTNKSFYKHLLLDTYFKERINVSPYLDNGKILYKYRLQLFSEAKKLETIQLPNISITQPVKFGNKKTKTVYHYIKQFVNMYSPKIKIAISDNQWKYFNKYYLDPKLKEIFGNVYSPSFSLNNPNLRDVLKNLMLVKDQIPIVIDDMISCLDVTKRNGIFEEKGILSVVSSLNSENYCDSLKRTYNNALSQENTCKSIEFLNFRNSDQALMTLDNMRLETRFPIYKINKIYMCYFKKHTVADLVNGELSNSKTKNYLCQQDITPLVKLNSERQLLKKDWNDFENNFEPKTIEQLSKYRMATVGYDIGSKYITGWGEKYSYIKSNVTWFKYDRTYIENILKIVDKINPYGDKEYFMLDYDNNKEQIIVPSYIYSNYENFINPFSDVSNLSLGLKGLIFKIEYEGFYNGTVVHSKNSGYSDITINDNSSASLTLLEKDGLFQKEKVNRFSNEQVTIQARYTDINDVQPLGSVYGNDIIIYHKEISIFDNVILATYYGTKDYVLKNYFTTVFAKHRPYNLLPYEESTIRSENKKVFLNFSKNKLLYEKNKTFNFDIKNILNFFKANTNEDAIFSNELLLKNEEINAGYMKINGEKFASDVNTFVSGDSLCLNMAMYDNVSGGVYIKEKEPDTSLMFDNVKKDFTGSVQDWYITVDDVETGSLKNIGFYFSHNEDNLSKTDFFDDYIKNNFYGQIFKLPKITNQNNEETNLINGEFEINKDNKELIDMTFQFEPISTTNDVFFSQWMMKLSNLLGVYNKIDKEIEIKDSIFEKSKVFTFNSGVVYSFRSTLASEDRSLYPVIILKVHKKDFDTINTGTNIEKKFDYNWKEEGSIIAPPNMFRYFITFYSIQLKNVNDVKKENNEITEMNINVIEHMFIDETNWEEQKTDTIYRTMKFISTKNFCGIDLKDVFTDENESSEDYFYFTNMDFEGEYATGTSNLTATYKEEFKNNLIYANGIDADKLVFLADSEKNFNALRLLVDKEKNILKENVTKNEHEFTTYYGGGEITTDIYPKNMFIVLSEQPMKEHLVYDEYEDISEVSGYVLTDYKVGDIISLNDKSGPHINVNLNGINETDYQSVQMWYYVDGSYKFVFGVNVTKDDKDIGNIKIYVSTISNKDPRVFDSNGLLVGEVVNYLEEDINYGEEQYFKKK